MILVDILFLYITTKVGFKLIHKMNEHYPILPKKYFKYLFLYHTFFSVAYCMMTKVKVADSLAYYYGSTFALRPGTAFIDSITFVLSDVFFLPYLSTFLIFHTIAFFWMPLFYLSIRENIVTSPRLLQLLHWVLFIPGLSFWTAFLGKDGLMILGICSFFFSINRIGIRKKWFALGIVLMFMIRPHICALVLLSFGMGLIFHLRYFKSKFILSVVFIGVLSFPFLFLMIFRYLSLDVSSLSDIFQLFEYFKLFQDKWQVVNLRGGSAVDIREYPFYLKVFTFMFRPLFFDAKGALMLFSSIENAIYLMFSCLIFHRYSVDFIVRRKSLFYTVNVFFLVFIVSFMSITITNMGLANRMKVMAIPSLISIFFISQSHERKISTRKKHEKNNIFISA
jgi:hypothetical protein